MAEFSTGFRLHPPDGGPIDGAELPSGRVIAERLDDAYLMLAMTLGDLLERLPPGTRVEWPAAGSPT
jgi:hypothetical protein